jgi:hypothetical protein
MELFVPAPPEAQRCAAPDCDNIRPADAPHTWRTCSPRCRSQVSPAHHTRYATRRAARAERAAALRAEAGPRTCAAPGCEVDISDRDYRTVTCSRRHRVLLSRSRRRQTD